tara:strand:- start:678 stop:953 length:276 start_codon:yes stop_codon:yes gene_type:complete
MKKITPRPSKKRLREYGENEFDRSPQMYSGGSKDMGSDSVAERLESIEDTISEMKSMLSTDSNLPTRDKMQYLNFILKIESELNLAQEEME